MVSNVNFQLKGIDRYRITMQKTFWKVLKAPKFEEDHNCKDYSRWEDLKLKDVIFNLFQWVSIIYPFSRKSSHLKFVCCTRRWNDGWVGPNFFAKNKTQVLSWVEKGQKVNLSQAQWWGVIWAIISQHCVCFEWSKLARWTWQNSQNVDWEFC